MTTKLVFPIVAALALGATAARADGVRHVPPAEAEAGAPLALSAQIDDAGHKNVFLHYRARGTAAWRDVAFTHAAGGDWVAAIPAEAMVPPGVEYYLSSSAVGEAAAATAAPMATQVLADRLALASFFEIEEPILLALPTRLSPNLLLSNPNIGLVLNYSEQQHSDHHCNIYP